MTGQARVPTEVAIAWRRLDPPGHDAAIVRAAGEGWLLEGATAFQEEGSPSHLRYTVRLDGRWHTRAVTVEGWFGTTPVRVAIIVGPSGDWLLNGHPVPEVSGAVDIDLAFTPATNLLPIRRLHLAVGESSRVFAAWLMFPEFTLRPLEQTYRRASVGAYDYSSSGGSFQASLSVSPDGFVTDYPGLWVQERG